MRTRIAGLAAAGAALATATILAGSGGAAATLYYLDPAWSPNGKEIAFASRDEGPTGDRGDLFVMNADGTKVRRLVRSTGANNNAPRGARYPTWSQQAAFVTASTAMLERLPYLRRYAWFALPSNSTDGTVGLYRSGARATAAGSAFRLAPGR